jgi:hypothetical protein
MKNMKAFIFIVIFLLLAACKEHTTSNNEVTQTHGTGEVSGNGLLGGWLLKYYTNGKGTHVPASDIYLLQMTWDSVFIQMRNDTTVSSYSFTTYTDTLNRLFIALKDSANTRYIVDTVNTDSLVYWDRKIDGNIYHYRRLF